MEIINLVDKLPRHPTKQYAKRELSELKYLVIHHSGTAEGDAFSFAKYHVEARNWPGIGYDYVISKNGTIYKVNNLTTVNYHVGNANRESVGVCLVGNFEAEDPTDKQYLALSELAIVLCQEYKLEVKKHGDLMNTTCPGKNFELGKLFYYVANYNYEQLQKTIFSYKSILRELKQTINKINI